MSALQELISDELNLNDRCHAAMQEISDRLIALEAQAKPQAERGCDDEPHCCYNCRHDKDHSTGSPCYKCYRTILNNWQPKQAQEPVFGSKEHSVQQLKALGKQAQEQLWICPTPCDDLSCGCLRSEAQKRRIKKLGAWNEGKSYSVEGGDRCYKTKHGWAKAARRLYGDKCQKCGWDKGHCDVHHRNQKSKGGLHTLENAIVLCPNCHRVLHERGDAE